MVVDDQDSNANHETPFPTLRRAGDYPIVGRRHRRGYDAGALVTSLTGRGTGTAAARPPPRGDRRPTSDAVPDCLAP
ncbi:hypothetical protein GCM10017779_10550 [Streptomyces capillispiralis]|nr:hypothetical protein GCM10017779_10550 [Streptomyces capillispiralis]